MTLLFVLAATGHYTRHWKRHDRQSKMPWADRKSQFLRAVRAVFLHHHLMPPAATKKPPPTAAARFNLNLNELTSKITAFRDARDWKQFHKANQLSAAIAIEAAELQEHFLWKTAGEVESKIADPKQRLAIAEELADVLIFSLLLAHELKVDPTDIILRKLDLNMKRYPVEKARGSAAKYTEL